MDKRRKTKERGGRGFTVVELLLAMGILTILMTIIMRVFVELVETRLESQATSAVVTDSRFILERLDYDTRRADSVATPANPGDSGSTLELVVEGTSYSYSLSGGNLILTRGAVSEQVNSAGTRVTSASFTKVGGATGNVNVKVEIGLESVTETVAGKETTELRTTIGDRL